MAKKTEQTKSDTNDFDDFIKGGGAEDNMTGFEQIDQSTMAIPFIRILQKLSPQLNRQNVEYIEEAEEGVFFNTVSKSIYGEAINVVVLKFEHVYIEWLPDRGGFVDYHTPENAERIAVDKTFGKWKTASGNLLQENYVYFILIEGHEHEGIHVFSVSSSMIKGARAWNKLLVSHIMPNGNRAMPYYIVWTLRSEYRQNDMGSWYAFKAEFNRYINKEQYTMITDERKVLPSRQVNYAELESKSETSEGTGDEQVPY